MKQKDLIGIAKTGSGKTLGFSVPFLALSEDGPREGHRDSGLALERSGTHCDA